MNKLFLVLFMGIFRLALAVFPHDQVIFSLFMGICTLGVCSSLHIFPMNWNFFLLFMGITLLTRLPEIPLQRDSPAFADL